LIVIVTTGSPSGAQPFAAPSVVDSVAVLVDVGEGGE
jgi:hypothetical protein